MVIRFRNHRLSVYKVHELTGERPVRELQFINYSSHGHGKKQCNFSLKLGLTTFHLKLAR